MSRIDFPKIYNPANQTPQELIENFVVRTKLFEEIFNDIKNSAMKHPEQHYIIQGIRGQGKTTLLLRIAYEIDCNPELRKRIIPIIFNEEQYSINRLFKLWEAIAEYLEELNEISGLYEDMRKFENDNDYEWRCFQVLETALKDRRKKAVLFIDNIDELLSKFSKKEHHRLREVLIASAEFRIIGASSESLEFHYDYGKPFYEFFRMPRLKGLDTEETRTFLLKLGEHYKRERVRDIVQNQPGRIEALRRLTGGVIRTIVILFEIFVDDTKGTAFRDLEKILDSVTPLYKHRMDKLSAQQQEIVDFIALNWDAVSTREIAGKTRLQSKAISSQLKQLEKYQIIEKEKTTTKNYLYRVSERFFNIWYLMRHGRKWDEKRVRFLVEFLQIWCDEKELEKRAHAHIQAVKQGTAYEKHALFLTEALARTPLKRELQHQLIAETRSYLSRSHSELRECLSKSDIELKEDVLKALISSDFEKAASLMENIKVKNVDDLLILGELYALYQKDFIKSEACLLKAVDMGHSDAMNNLAFLYQKEFKDFEKAEKYYLMAVEKEQPVAMNNLALLYQTEFKDFEKAEKYYLMAVEKEHAGAMNNLAWLYFNKRTHRQKALTLAEESYEKEKILYHAHTLSMILLWNDDIKRAEDIARFFLEQKDSFERFPEDISFFLMFLIAKKQYHLLLKIFEENPYHLKDRYKPVYYALMHFMKNEYPNEYRKMGDELKQTVEEIIEKIHQLAKDYE